MYVIYSIDILTIFVTSMFIVGKCNTQLENGLCISYRSTGNNLLTPPPRGGLLFRGCLRGGLLEGGGAYLIFQGRTCGSRTLYSLFKQPEDDINSS